MKNFGLKTLVVVTLIFLVFTITAFTITSNNKNCDDVKSYADDAYSYFRKSYNSSSIEDVHIYVKKGMNSTSSA